MAGMADFKTFYRGLRPEQREAFAERIHTTTGYCHQIAAGTKRLELGLADAIVAVVPEFGGYLGLAELPLTDRARAQDSVRKSAPSAANEPWDGTERRTAAS